MSTETIIARAAGSLLLLAALSACSSSTDASIVNGVNTACHVASVAEAADPSLAAHNQKVVAGVTVLCATAGAVTPATVLPLPPAASTPQATVLPLPPVHLATVLPLPPRA